MPPLLPVQVFDAMFRLCADSESSVQSAVQFLDNLVKDIVTASSHFNVDAFIPKLRDYLRVINPHKRQFLISWITGALRCWHAAGDMAVHRNCQIMQVNPLATAALWLIIISILGGTAH